MIHGQPNIKTDSTLNKYIAPSMDMFLKSLFTLL